MKPSALKRLVSSGAPERIEYRAHDVQSEIKRAHFNLGSAPDTYDRRCIIELPISPALPFRTLHIGAKVVDFTGWNFAYGYQFFNGETPLGDGPEWFYETNNYNIDVLGLGRQILNYASEDRIYQFITSPHNNEPFVSATRRLHNVTADRLKVFFRGIGNEEGLTKPLALIFVEVQSENYVA